MRMFGNSNGETEIFVYYVLEMLFPKTTALLKLMVYAKHKVKNSLNSRQIYLLKEERKKNEPGSRK